MEDAVTTAPDLYRVVEENDRVRILEFKGGPGAKSEMHSHPAMVAIGITDTVVKFTLPNGQSIEIEMDKGHPMYLDAVEHATEISGTSEAHVILVELK